MSDVRRSVLHLVANPRSGKGIGAGIGDEARRVAASLGGRVVVHSRDENVDLAKIVEQAVTAARRDGGIVVGAGGDGTLRNVAEAAARAGVPFAAVPCGTFNFFARAHRIPEDPIEALHLAFTGELRPVRLGRMNDHDFLINASLGLYAKAIRAREKATRWMGRARIVATLASARALLGRFRPMEVELITDGRTERRQTLSVFIGNNALQLRDLALDVARCMHSDKLAVVLLKPMGRRERLRVLWRGLARTLEKEENLETFCVDSLVIGLRSWRTPVALDGEMFLFESPLVVRAMPGRLLMALPPRGETA
jgi:diacylglycerol kinase family enzyme